MAVSSKKLKLNLGIDSEQFLQDRYKDYLKIQEDWMNFNYDGLRENLTDELYNQYEMQLETLKTKNEQNIMSDFTYKNGMITDVVEENGMLVITLEMIVCFKDYIVDSNKNVLRGDEDNFITMHYEMVFVSKINDIVDKCPNCGAPLSDSASQKCEYCGSVISLVSNKWVLSKKEAKSQS